jgi:hypothetical protein
MPTAYYQQPNKCTRLSTSGAETLPLLNGSGTKRVKYRRLIDPKQAQEVLDGLVQQGFITAHDLSYHYDPHTQEMRNMMERIVELYARYLVPVTHLIHSKSKSRVQEFADAFRIRKD